MSRTRVVHVSDNVPGAIYIGRGNGRRKLARSKWANPYPITETRGRKDAIILFEQYLVTHPELWADLPELRGKALACWCRRDGVPMTDDNRCHGDALAGLVNCYTDDDLRALAEQDAARQAGGGGDER